MSVLQFKGKTAIEGYHHTVPHHTVEFDAKQSVLQKGEKPGLDGNLIIQGDNLIALKALVPTHAGRIKCIYIDPPYNTGNEGWIYNDNLTQPQFKEWIGQTVGKEGEDATRHDKWCCMMYPRLQLLKELLRDDGAMFVSIDENEFHNLRMMMDEIFRVEMPLATLVWKRRSPSGMRKDPVSVDHEYVLLYAKDRSRIKLSGLFRTAADYPLEDKKGKYASTDLTIGMTAEDRPNQFYDITNPKTKVKYPGNPNRVWRFEPDMMKEVIEDKLVIWPDEEKDSEMTRPRYKTYFDPANPKIKPLSSWIESSSRSRSEIKEESEDYDIEILTSGLNAEGGRILQRIFGKKLVDYPKPPSLIKSLIRAATSKDDIVLDSFAGSGTTAHALLELNKEDGGNRKFILVQLPYDTKENEKDKFNICKQITAERLRRVIDGYTYNNAKGKKETVEGLGGSFAYACVGKSLFGEYRDWGQQPPLYEELAKYIFYTETSRDFDRKVMNEKTGKIGEHHGASYYLLYTSNGQDDRRLDMEWLKGLDKTEKNKNLVIYCEKIWVHRDDLAKFEQETKRTGATDDRPVQLEVSIFPMQLKPSQERVIKEVKLFLEALATEQANGSQYPSLGAWDKAKKLFYLPGEYRQRKNGLEKDLPTFCVKVPTGGGKTLLATQILGLVHQTILKNRNGSGLVLCVVPSDQIYKDTLKAFRDRRHFYRESLEFALSRRIEVWEKHEIFRLTPGQLRSNLNILILKLASTNRETREQLKFFRDSGGNIVQDFPPENDPDRHKALKIQFPNLDMLGDDENQDERLVKTSLGNLVRLCEPAVILDEGHKATSELARKTIEGFNASIVVELSATPPKEANVLVRVTGKELLDEQMIKLPINIANSNQPSWRNCLTQAREKREHLAKLTERHYRATEKLIRPIVLVQVERTGKDQRDAGFVHSEDVKQYLLEREGVQESAIAIKTSEKDDIEGIDLLAEGCPVEWIITKAALQEGWDCPFAYILVSLNNTGSQQSMTQLVGRVLRQPYVERTPFDELNESYVYCLKRRATDISREVKKALEQEGYEGEAASVVDRSTDHGKSVPKRQATIREEFRRYYREFEGKIYLPRFCVKHGNSYVVLDYFRHLLSQVEVTRFDYGAIDWNMTAALEAAKDSIYRLTLEQDDLERVAEREAVTLETDEQVKAWLVASLPFEFFSQKQLRDVVSRVVERLYQLTPELSERLGLVKFEIREKIVGLIERGTDRQTQEAFETLFNNKRLRFYLECVEGRFEIPPKIDIRGTKRLIHDDNEPIQRSLFDYVGDDLNDYEKSVALYLDRHPEVLWWYRNLIGAQYFSIQGYRRNKLYPDFVVQQGHNKKPVASVIVVESKGKHLKGNEDTNYKRKIASYFQKVGYKVPWQKLAADFEDETFRVQVLDEGEYTDRDWRDDLKKLLESTS